MSTPMTAKKPVFGKSGITIWWFLLSVLIGIVAMVFIQLPKKWFLTLFTGTFVLFISLTLEDKEKFYILLLIIGMIFGFSKTLLFTASPMYRSTFGYTVPIFFLPLLMLYLIWALRTVTHKFSTPISTVGLLPFAGLFVMSTISTLLHNKLFGSFDLFELAICGLLFIYAASVIDERRLRMIVIFLIVSTVAEAVIAIAQNLTGSSLGLQFFGARPFIKGYMGLLTLTRVTGTFGHPSNLAEFFDTNLPLAVSMLFFPMRKSFKIILLVAVVIGFLGLGMTYSRGGIISSALFSGIVLLIHLCKRLGTTRGIFASIALGVLFSLLILTIPNPIQKGLFRTEYETAYGRIPLMDVAYRMIRANPWFGVGLNNYVPVAVNYDFTPEQLTTGWDTAVHNVYLFIAGEIGIPGLLFFLGIIVSVTIAFWPTIRSPDPLLFCAGLGIYAGVAAHLFHWFTDLAPWTTAFVFWFLMGLAVTTGRLSKSIGAVSERAAIGK